MDVIYTVNEQKDLLSFDEILAGVESSQFIVSFRRTDANAAQLSSVRDESSQSIGPSFFPFVPTTSPIDLNRISCGFYFKTTTTGRPRSNEGSSC